MTTEMEGLMKNVWWVESGEYSDYRVHGVFTTRERAELFAKHVRPSWDANPTVRWVELDGWIDPLEAGLRPIRVMMRIDGTFKSEPSDNWERTDDVGLQVVKASDSWKPADDYIAGWVWAEDDAHAAKIANEFRTQAIANGEMVRVTIREVVKEP